MMICDASQLCQLLITTPLSQRNHQPFTTTPLDSSVTAQGINGKSALWLKLNGSLARYGLSSQSSQVVAAFGYTTVCFVIGLVVLLDLDRFEQIVGLQP